MAHLRGPYIWETHEFLYQEKTSDWYWAVGIIAISAAVITIIFGNILFALFILIAAFSLALFAAKRPEVIRFEINNTGVLINKTLYPYTTLHSFWVEDNNHYEIQSKVIFKSKRLAMPLLVLPLEEIHPEEIRDFLFDHLPEEEHTEAFSQKVLEYLGF